MNKLVFTNNNIVGKIIFDIAVIILVSCKSPKTENNTDQDLSHVISICNCDTLLRDEIFLKHDQIYWPVTKPKSVVEAIIALDSMTNNFTKHLFKICDPIVLHHGMGTGIRNEWIRHGENELKEQLFNKLYIDHIDNSTGLILSLFREYLKDSEIDYKVEWERVVNPDSLNIARKELQKIVNDLNRVKK